MKIKFQPTQDRNDAIGPTPALFDKSWTLQDVELEKRVHTLMTE